MDFKQFRRAVIKPTLMRLAEINSRLDSVVAQELLIGTLATESLKGRWLLQVRGPALGFYQVEPATLKDLYTNYLQYRAPLRKALNDELAPAGDRESQLVTNLAYATAVARLVYWRAPAALPERHDDEEKYLEALGQYWKTHYNTVKGKGTVEKFVKDFPREIL